MIKLKLHLLMGIPRLDRIYLPRTPRDVTHLRWWQPDHGGSGQDQWAIDDIILGGYDYLDTFYMASDVSPYHPTFAR